MVCGHKLNKLVPAIDRLWSSCFGYISLFMVKAHFFMISIYGLYNLSNEESQKGVGERP